MMSTLQDASVKRGRDTRQWARSLIARMTTDTVAMAIAERGVMLPPPPLTSFITDAHGNPSETVNLEHYGRVAAERERRRRLAE
jgi:hypothetical protein